jgi:AcrR family transcriptional regulator
MTEFQRARSEQQRELRRQTILDTAARMLEEMPAAEVSLNELSRRVGLAKSNVLRYFESREAVLLDLLDRAWKEWLAALPALLGSTVDGNATVGVRVNGIATVLSRSLAERRVFCDLLSTQAAVLERNVSPEVAARYKRAAVTDVDAMADLVCSHLPELSACDARHLCAMIVMSVGAVWSHAHPSAAMIAACENDAELAMSSLDFTAATREMIEILTIGELTRHSMS